MKAPELQTPAEFEAIRVNRAATRRRRVLPRRVLTEIHANEDDGEDEFQRIEEDSNNNGHHLPPALQTMEDALHLEGYRTAPTPPSSPIIQGTFLVTASGRPRHGSMTSSRIGDLELVDYRNTRNRSRNGSGSTQGDGTPPQQTSERTPFSEELIRALNFILESRPESDIEEESATTSPSLESVLDEYLRLTDENRSSIEYCSSHPFLSSQIKCRCACSDEPSGIHWSSAECKCYQRLLDASESRNITFVLNR